MKQSSRINKGLIHGKYTKTSSFSSLLMKWYRNGNKETHCIPSWCLHFTCMLRGELLWGTKPERNTIRIAFWKKALAALRRIVGGLIQEAQRPITRLLQWSRLRRCGLKPVTGRMKRREGSEIWNRENRGFMINWLEKRGYMSIQLAGDYMVWSWEWRMHSERHLDVFSEFVWYA